MRGRALGVGVAGVLLLADGQFGLREQSTARAAAATVRSELPSPQTARTILNSTNRHGEFMDVRAGASTAQAYVVHPDRADKAPVVLVTSNDQGMSDWMRAVGDQLAAEGYIAVVPEVLTESVRSFAARLPSANGTTAALDFESIPGGRGRIVAAVASQKVSFDLAGPSWPRMVAFLNERTDNRPVFVPSAHAHAGHALAAMAQEERVDPRTLKNPDLPADHRMARKILATSPRKSGWVDVPLAEGKLRTWVSYPQRTDKAPAVLVIHPSPGYMEWTRGVADQLAQEGFLAVAPDFLSGMGPNGGGQEAFEFPDDIVKAMGRLKDDESMRRMKAAREYILKMPMANGQLAAMGFCWGGEMAFLLAAEAPDLKAAVVYYGGAPEATEMAKIKAPILGFYGTDDVRLTSTIGPAAAEMKKLGKTFETHIYEHATHAFLYMQGLADNNKATADSWPKAIALLKKSMS